MKGEGLRELKLLLNLLGRPGGAGWVNKDNG